MSAIDLALGAGVLLVAGWAVFLLRRRRPRARLARLSRSPGDVAPERRGPSVRWRRWGTVLADRAVAALIERPVASVIACTSLFGGATLLLAGPVAATAVALYAVVASIGGHRWLVRRAADRAVTELLDAIDAAAGDLRAGIVPGGSAADLVPGPGESGSRRGDGGSGRRNGTSGGTSGGRDGGAGRRGRGPDQARRREDVAVQVAVARLEAAHRISSALGMPLADLLDRVDADLRAGQALRVGIAAQTSSAQATTVLLLGLPLVGLWVGAALGTDPLGQLLHTPLGAACAMVAVSLQCAGLLWTGRMIHAVTAEVR